MCSMRQVCNQTGETCMYSPDQHTLSFLEPGRGPRALLPWLCYVHVQTAAINVFAVEGSDRGLSLGEAAQDDDSTL